MGSVPANVLPSPRTRVVYERHGGPNPRNKPGIKVNGGTPAFSVRKYLANKTLEFQARSRSVSGNIKN